MYDGDWERLILTDTVEKYNPNSDERTTFLEPIPSKRSGIGTTRIDDLST